MKKSLLPFLSTLLLIGCSPTVISSSSSELTKYTVTFANTTLSNAEVAEGGSLAKPSDPNKDGYLFVGWYLDSACNKEASFPLVVTADITLYASYYSYEEAFKKARENTIGEGVDGYEYDYTLDVSVTYAGAGLTGKTAGNSKYNAKNSDVSYYDEHTNSGALFYDGSKYKIKKGKDLHEISLDENGIIKKYEIVSVDDSYRYDSSSFAKAVFEYDDEDLKNIEKTSVAGQYKLNTAFNFSSAVSILGSYVNHPMVEAIVGKLPSTSVDTAMYVGFDKDKLSSYKYTMKIDVTGIKFDLTYALSFKNIGVAPTINPKSFGNVYVSSSDIAQSKAKAEKLINEYKTLEHSSYDYKAKTAVGYEGKNDINATVKGFTKRKVDGSSVYFLNDYEVDTDHKNADLYKEKGLADCHAGRTKLSNGEVHDLKKKLLSGYEDLGVVTPSSDDYYLLDILSSLSSTSFVQEITNEDKNTVTYSFGGVDATAKSLLGYFNNSLRLNPLGACSSSVLAFGTFNESSVSLDDFECRINAKAGSLISIELEMNGLFKTSFPESRDFTTEKEASFSLSFSLTTNDKGKNYEPSSKVSEVK